MFCLFVCLFVCFGGFFGGGGNFVSSFLPFFDLYCIPSVFPLFSLFLLSPLSLPLPSFLSLLLSYCLSVCLPVCFSFCLFFFSLFLPFFSSSSFPSFFLSCFFLFLFFPCLFPPFVCSCFRLQCWLVTETEPATRLTAQTRIKPLGPLHHRPSSVKECRDQKSFQRERSLPLARPVWLLCGSIYSPQVKEASRDCQPQPIKRQGVNRYDPTTPTVSIFVTIRPTKGSALC